VVLNSGNQKEDFMVLYLALHSSIHVCDFQSLNVVCGN